MSTVRVAGAPQLVRGRTSGRCFRFGGAGSRKRCGPLPRSMVRSSFGEVMKVRHIPFSGEFRSFGPPSCAMTLERSRRKSRRIVIMAAAFAAITAAGSAAATSPPAFGAISEIVPFGESRACEQSRSLALSRIADIASSTAGKRCREPVRVTSSLVGVDSRGIVVERWQVSSTCGEQSYDVAFDQGSGRVAARLAKG